MAVEEIIRWLRRQHDSTQELVSRLRERVATPPRGGKEYWIEELCSRFDDLANHLRRRMTEEEESGYLKPVLEARPSLVAAVEVLRHEHRELARLLDGLHRSVHQLLPKHNLLLRDCCKRIENLLCWIERHEEHENHVVLYGLVPDAQREP